MQPYYSQQPPAWIDGRTVEMEYRERAMFRSVFGWMFVAMLLTAVASLAVVTSPALQQVIFGNRFVIWILWLAEIGLVMNLSWRLPRLSPTAAAGSLIVYSLLTGLSLSVLAFVYTGASIVQTFVVTAGMFGAMALWGIATKRDLTSWGSFLFMGVIGVVLLSVVNAFMHSETLSAAFSFIGIFIFVGLTAYQAQMLKRMASTATGPMREKIAIYGALALYITFVNLFLSLLRFTGNRRR